MTHRYTAAPDGWFAFITPARQLFVGGAPDATTIERLWGRIRDEEGPAGVLETLAEGGLFATPPFAFVELGDADAAVIVRGDAVVRAGGEDVSGAGASTWVERRLPGTDVAVTLSGAAGPELPIETGVVRAAAFASAGDRMPTAAPAAAAAKPAPATAAAAVPPPSAPAVQPEAADDAPEAFPDATIPLAQFIAEEEARARAAAQSAASEVSEETVMELPDAPAVLPAPVTPAAASVPGAAVVSGSDADSYDYLFGETVFHNVQDAVVHAPGDDDAPPSATAEHPADTGDHDGNTVLATAVSHSGRMRRKRGEAPPAAPVIAVVLPNGAREVLDEALVVGRSPSVAGVPGGQLPRLVTLAGGDQDISRSHVRIALEGGTAVVTDLHSRNGTSIVLPSGETQKLRAGDPTPVIAGTVIDLGGGVELRLEEI